VSYPHCVSTYQSIILCMLRCRVLWCSLVVQYLDLVEVNQDATRHGRGALSVVLRGREHREHSRSGVREGAGVG
jgi:hypothetical protein